MDVFKIKNGYLPTHVYKIDNLFTYFKKYVGTYLPSTQLKFDRNKKQLIYYLPTNY